MAIALSTIVTMVGCKPAAGFIEYQSRQQMDIGMFDRLRPSGILPVTVARERTSLVKIAILAVSDRASQGVYADQGDPEIEAWLRAAIMSPFDILYRVIPDGTDTVAAALIDLIDGQSAELVLTTGGTGPSLRDETPEGTKAVIDKELPGFGEQLRRESLRQTPTAILSRQIAGMRGR